MVRFPHSAVITWIDAATYNESTGAFTKGTEHTLAIQGRAIAQLSAVVMIKTEDGSEIQAGYKFISRPIGQKIPFGASIQITFPDFIHTAKVLRHEPFQTFSEIWL